MGFGEGVHAPAGRPQRSAPFAFFYGAPPTRRSPPRTLPARPPGAWPDGWAGWARGAGWRSLLKVGGGAAMDKAEEKKRKSVFLG